MIALILLLRVGLLSGALWLAGWAARGLPLALRRRVSLFSLAALLVLVPFSLFWQHGLWNFATGARAPIMAAQGVADTSLLTAVVWALIGIYSVGVALGLTRFTVGMAGLLRMPRAMAPFQAQALLRTLCPDRHKRPRLLMSARCSLPFTTGLWPLNRGVIVLPVAMAVGADRATLAAILRHELQHLAAHDPLWAVLSRLLCTLFWPIPFVHALSEQMEEVQEAEADVAAVSGQALPVKALYAECLIALAARTGAHRPVAAVCRAVGRGLAVMESRIRLILSDQPAGAADVATRRTLCRGVSALLVLSMPVIFLIGISPERPVRSSVAPMALETGAGQVSLERMEQELRGEIASTTAPDGDETAAGVLNRDELRLRDGL